MGKTVTPIVTNERYYAALASLNGLGVITDANIDYSGAEVIYKIKPAADEVIILARLIGYIYHAQNGAADKYGNLGNLTNGINVTTFVNGEETQASLIRIKSNSDWAGLCFDQLPSQYGAGFQYNNYRWSFNRSGAPIPLNGSLGDEVRIYLHDNFDALLGHLFRFEGRIYNV